MNDRLEYRRSLGLPKDLPEEWKCAGCGASGPDRFRRCECPTNVVVMQCSDGRTFTEWKQDMPPPETVEDWKGAYNRLLADYGSLQESVTAGYRELTQEIETYRSRWLSCVTPEEAQRLKDRLAEADAVVAYFQFDEGGVVDGGVFRSNINRWADEALERYRARQQERKDNGQFGVGA